jgi:23S rRNA pseudouridine955/2504/2580 synthase
MHDKSGCSFSLHAWRLDIPGYDTITAIHCPEEIADWLPEQTELPT